jgi:glutathione S-transferase
MQDGSRRILGHEQLLFRATGRPGAWNCSSQRDAGVIELFLHPASPNCMAVLMAGHQAGISLSHRLIQLKGDGQAPPELLAVNPNGLVPTLRDGDLFLWETVAILQYVASKAGDTPLWPRDDRGRADIARWQCWSLAHWTPALQPFIFENIFKGMRGLGGPNQEHLKRAEAVLWRHGRVLDHHLQDRDWAVGQSLTLADISLAAYLMYARGACIPLAAFPNILRWFERLESLPAWQAAQPAPLV